MSVSVGGSHRHHLGPGEPEGLDTETISFLRTQGVPVELRLAGCAGPTLFTSQLADGVLKRNEIVTLARYVRSLSGLPVPAGTDMAAGQKLFAENCATCHGDAAKGNREIGAPDLTDRIWLYGSDEASIIEVVTNGKNGVMPTWADKLDRATLKALAVYVHSLGGGQ